MANAHPICFGIGMALLIIGLVSHTMYRSEGHILVFLGITNLGISYLYHVKAS